MYAFLEKLTALIIRWVFALLDSSEGARHLEKHAEFPYGESFHVQDTHGPSVS